MAVLGARSRSARSAPEVRSRAPNSKTWPSRIKTVITASAIFDGLTSLLEVFDSNNIPWGVVTNKPQYLTDPLIAELGLAERLACCVSGDTLPQRKPDPAPLHHACEIAGMNVVETIYVGDAARDIEAGRAATMGTVAVAYGYITPDDSVAAWGADAIAADTQELAQILLKAVNLGP